MSSLIYKYDTPSSEEQIKPVFNCSPLLAPRTSFLFLVRDCQCVPFLSLLLLGTPTSSRRASHEEVQLSTMLFCHSHFMKYTQNPVNYPWPTTWRKFLRRARQDRMLQESSSSSCFNACNDSKIELSHPLKARSECWTRQLLPPD